MDVLQQALHWIAEGIAEKKKNITMFLAMRIF
jgi:hypothetical protein